MAARSLGDLPEEVRGFELYRGAYRITDTSRKAQEQALESYLDALRQASEELE